jgi:aminomuconate-semialdehyde/2-hydroxymuconate-6-semialdehyde dehydrogenase
LVAATAAPMFKKLSLELGGKNSSIVFADAEMSLTLPGIVRASFTNNGQVCLCGSRLLVEESIYDEFVNKLVEEVKKIKVGDPLTHDYGALSSLQHREKIEYYVNLAKESGGKILAGGKVPDYLQAPFTAGAFYEPTIIAGKCFAQRHVVQ